MPGTATYYSFTCLVKTVVWLSDVSVRYVHEFWHSFYLWAGKSQSQYRMSTKHSRHAQTVALWKWLIFGADSDQHVDPVSLFYFLYHCRIKDFRRFLTISHTVTGRFLRNLAKWLIRQTSGSGLIWKSGFKSLMTFGWYFSFGGVCVLCMLLFAFIVIMSVFQNTSTVLWKVRPFIVLPPKLLYYIVYCSIPCLVVSFANFGCAWYFRTWNYNFPLTKTSSPFII